MGKILEMDAYIVLIANHNTVIQDLGKYHIGVPVDTGMRTAAITSPVPDGSYNVFDGLVDDLTLLGGDTPMLASHETAVNTIKQYVPMVNGKVLSFSESLGNCALKLVNKVGQYALKNLNATATAVTLYNADGTYLRGSSGNTISLSYNGYGLNGSPYQYIGITVGGFDDEGKFTPDYPMYYYGFSGTRALTRGTVNSAYTNDARVINFLNNIKTYVVEDDPYGPGGYSGPGGGDGGFDFDGVPDAFTGDMTGVMTGMNTGFFTIYHPSAAELTNLANYLWSNSFDLDVFKKLFNNPMELFLTLNMLPFDVPSGQQKEVGFGLISSGVYMTTAADRYYTKTFGPLEVKERWGGYLDYAPYIKAEMYLPYIGTVPIDIDDIMNQYIEVVYVVDVLSGGCVAGINKWKRSLGAVRPAQAYCIGRHSGNAATQLPITGSDYSTLLTGIFSAVSGAVAGAVSGGGAGAVAGGLAAASSAVVNDSKPQIAKGGSAAGVHGWLSTQHPSLITHKD